MPLAGYVKRAERAVDVSPGLPSKFHKVATAAALVSVKVTRAGAPQTESNPMTKPDGSIPPLTVTGSVTVAAQAPKVSVMVTLYVPGAPKSWVTLEPEAVPPSPKD